ncbi:MAG TPA: RNA polymerase sigma factor [Vicinamibacterales bacterium]|nr:RNA polymerase sigma factor [Vicinamibacterales bacterium]
MAGSTEAARQLFQAHGGAVYRFAAVLVRQHQDAEDVVQETFLKLLRHLEGGGDTSNIRGWLFTVAAHAARDRQRARMRWVPWLPAHEPRVQPPVLPDEDGRLKSARESLRRLPDRDRLLLLLRAQGLSYREMAVAAGVKPTSVGQLLARAVDRWAAARKDGNAYDLLERHSHPGAR